MKLTDRDRQRLEHVHPDLVRLVEGGFQAFDHAFASTPGLSLFVIEGARSMFRQQELFNAGASQVTTGGRHLIHADGMAYAVDLGVRQGQAMRWEMPIYRRLYDAVMAPAAARLGIPITAGVLWARFPDGPHYELRRDMYPGTNPPLPDEAIA